VRVRGNLRETVKQEYDRQITCSRCGAKIDECRSHDVFEVTIEATKGSRYPEGSYTTDMAVDCCRACWPVAVAALEAAGFVFAAYDGQWYDGAGWPGETRLDRDEWGLT
jgi:hypothetical protein